MEEIEKQIRKEGGGAYYIYLRCGGLGLPMKRGLQNGGKKLAQRVRKGAFEGGIHLLGAIEGRRGIMLKRGQIDMPKLMAGIEASPKMDKHQGQEGRIGQRGGMLNRVDFKHGAKNITSIGNGEGLWYIGRRPLGDGGRSGGGGEALSGSLNAGGSSVELERVKCSLVVNRGVRVGRTEIRALRQRGPGCVIVLPSLGVEEADFGVRVLGAMVELLAESTMEGG
ncbi:hypothetical protein Cgig2_017645 [Carnegiea gigantea]|uniref:Uncharacterized protein n=1 Tax=Carnegiea gigantea TaxID=171969 RepID=A0A9Q1QFN3_9CARY|nr:hypothetical protein Cgig2_017645 [Carnegiea gigantea]